MCSHDHGGHEFVDVAKKLENLKLILRKDLTELMKTIYPKYQDIASNILIQKANLRKTLRKQKKLSTNMEKICKEKYTLLSKN